MASSPRELRSITSYLYQNKVVAMKHYKGNKKGKIMDRIDELELQVEKLEEEILRQKGMVACLTTMDSIQAQYEPLSSDGVDDEEVVAEINKDSVDYGEAQDKLRKLENGKEHDLMILDLNPMETTKKVSIDEFNSQELLDEIGLENRWELFELIERVNGKQIVTYMLDDEEVEESKIIVWNGSYLEFINFYKIDTIDLYFKGDE